ncbi:MAG: aminotransferase class V-fold PLP-dependent enzyme [Deltaproteobacteria bacterium]|nr:aminotransferase class V-fold PLP-dependent enzyme [Deltaproteobacteria bacterium]
MIYLDNAATSWPKAPGVAEAITRFLTDVGANPGRSGHRLSIEAARMVSTVRELTAGLFGSPDPLRVVFTLNVTHAINVALQGVLRPGDHVVTSSVEHNSMIRPLNALREAGISFTAVACASDGSLDPADIEASITPATAMIALTHASNVLGTLLPAERIGALARERGLLFLLDAASTAGCVPIDIVADNIDLLAFTGHKALLGPTGTGGLVIGERVNPARIRPVFQGGTGSRSATESQPPFLPDLLECGTLNTTGLAGLGAAFAWINATGIHHIQNTCRTHTRLLLERLQAIPGVSVYGPRDASLQTATVSFNIQGMSPSRAGQLLDERFGILCRVGLHCAPRAHTTIGTFPHGTIRFSPGVFSAQDEIAIAADAVECLNREARCE